MHGLLSDRSIHLLEVNNIFHLAMQVAQEVIRNLYIIFLV